MAAFTPITFNRIKEIADEQGYSLRTINNVAELGTNTIYGWKFKEPTIAHVEAVANVLGVSVITCWAIPTAVITVLKPYLSNLLRLIPTWKKSLP